MQPNESIGNEDKTSDEITVREAGRRGGRSTLQHHGIEFFREIGRKGGQRTAKIHADLLTAIGRKGGRPERPNLENSLGEEHRDKERG